MNEEIENLNKEIQKLENIQLNHEKEIDNFLLNINNTIKIPSEYSKLNYKINQLSLLDIPFKTLQKENTNLTSKLSYVNDLSKDIIKDICMIDKTKERLMDCLEKTEQLLNLRNCITGIRNEMKSIGTSSSTNLNHYIEISKYIRKFRDVELWMKDINASDKLHIENAQQELLTRIEYEYKKISNINNNNINEYNLQDLNNNIKDTSIICYIIEDEFQLKGLEWFLENIMIYINNKINLNNRINIENTNEKELKTNQFIIYIFNEIASCITQYDDIFKNYFLNIFGPFQLYYNMHMICENIVTKLVNDYIKNNNFIGKTAELEKIAKEYEVDKLNYNENKKNNINNNTQKLKNEDKYEEILIMLDNLLNDMVIFIQHTQTYDRFIRGKEEDAINLLMKEEKLKSKNDMIDVLTNLSYHLPSPQISELNKSIQELAGLYSLLENHFLSISCEKAFQYDEIKENYILSPINTIKKNLENIQIHLNHNNTENKPIITSSVVDEILYVCKNSALRSLATGHSDSIVIILKHVSHILKDILGKRLSDKFRKELPSYVKMVSFQPSISNTIKDSLVNNKTANLLASTTNQLKDSMQQQVIKLSKNVSINMGEALLPTSPKENNTNEQLNRFNINNQETNRVVLDVKKFPEIILNNIEVTVKYANQMKDQILEEIIDIFGQNIDKNLKNAITEMEETCQDLENLLNKSIDLLFHSFVPKLLAFLSLISPQNNKSITASSTISYIKYNLTEKEYINNEVNDPFVQQLISDIENLLYPYRKYLSDNNLMKIYGSFALFISNTIEENIIKKRYYKFNQLGALQLDKDIRILMNYFINKYDKCRDIFNKLSHISKIINVDMPQDALDYTLKNENIIVSKEEIAELLRLRIDFSVETIISLGF